MKRYLAIFGILFIGVIAGLIVRGIPIVLQVNAGGGIQADRNGDVNGDARLDMSDAVYLLLHIFRDGPQPVAFAQAEPADLRGLEGSMNRIADSLDNLVALEQGRIVPNIQRLEAPLTRIADSLENQNGGTGCDQRSDRFIWQEEDQAIIDTCKNLMWADHDFLFREFDGRPRNPNNILNNFQHAGHSDWRLPTVEELSSLWSNSPLRFSEFHINQPFQIRQDVELFTSLMFPGEDTDDSDYYFTFNFDSTSSERIRRSRVRRDRVDIGSYYVLPVRDIGPNE